MNMCIKKYYILHFGSSSQQLRTLLLEGSICYVILKFVPGCGAGVLRELEPGAEECVSERQLGRHNQVVGHEQPCLPGHLQGAHLLCLCCQLVRCQPPTWLAAL